jgi:hypothetical protein
MAQRRKKSADEGKQSKKAENGGEGKESKKAENGGEGEVTRGTAPSAPDIKKLEKFEPSEEAKQKEPSKEDAMGQDKRRQIVGHAYGPSKKSQILFFVTVGLVIAVLVGGYALAIAAFDQPEESYPDEAPWSKADAAQYDPGDPSDPCGEPGNPHPADPGSPCLEKEAQGEGGGGLPGGSAQTQSGSSNQAEE